MELVLPILKLLYLHCQFLLKFVAFIYVLEVGLVKLFICFDLIFKSPFHICIGLLEIFLICQLVVHFLQKSCQSFILVLKHFSLDLNFVYFRVFDGLFYFGVFLFEEVIFLFALSDHFLQIANHHVFFLKYNEKILLLPFRCKYWLYYWFCWCWDFRARPQYVWWAYLFIFTKSWFAFLVECFLPAFNLGFVSVEVLMSINALCLGIFSWVKYERSRWWWGQASSAWRFFDSRLLMNYLGRWIPISFLAPSNLCILALLIEVLIKDRITFALIV